MYGRGRGRAKTETTTIAAPGSVSSPFGNVSSSPFGNNAFPSTESQNSQPPSTFNSNERKNFPSFESSIIQESSFQPVPESQSNVNTKPFGRTTSISSEDQENADVDNPAPAEAALLAKLVSTGLKWVDEKNVTVTDQRKDKRNPLFGQVQTFDELQLQPEILRALHDMNFLRPSAIQSKALPILLPDPPNHMIAQSQSGTGKTAAFVIATLSRIDLQERYPQAILLSPTYELAKQTGDVIQAMSKYMSGFTMQYAIKGHRVSKGDVIDAHVIIGTPGTVMDWALKFRVFDITRIKVFVLDEADIMIDAQGHQDQSLRIHRALSKQSCQMMFFSATFSDLIMEFAHQIVVDPVLIMLKREELSLDSIKQYYIMAKDRAQKLEYLCALYRGINVGAAIIFCHKRSVSSETALKMKAEGMSVALLNGDLDVGMRVSVLNRFKEGKDTVLVTTNVCARGIDIERVNLVINFDLPLTQDGRRQPDMETYLHRIGRTGRFGRKGIAINMVEPRDFQHLQLIENHFEKPIMRLTEEDIEKLK